MYIFFNNKFYEKTIPIIATDSKAFRYGELVFETIRVQNNNILFYKNHFERLQKSAALLFINFPPLFTQNLLQLHIEATLKKNKLSNARVRVTLFKGNGGLFENDSNALNVLIETYTLPNLKYEFNSNGLDICFYETMLKTLDVYSNYKTGNHLIYAMAAHYAKLQKCNEAIVLNTNNSIADTTISNLFIIKNNCIYTPPISEGCIDGIFRTIVIQNLNTVQQKILTKADVLNADAVFVTNTIKGIQWVKQIENKNFDAVLVEKIWHILMPSITN